MPSDLVFEWRRWSELSGLFANPGPASFMQVIRPIVKILGSKEGKAPPNTHVPERRHHIHLSERQFGRDGGQLQVWSHNQGACCRLQDPPHDGLDRPIPQHHPSGAPGPWCPNALRARPGPAFRRGLRAQGTKGPRVFPVSANPCLARRPGRIGFGPNSLHRQSHRNTGWT